MAGKIKRMIDLILEKRGRGNKILLNIIRTKLILKGINPDKYTLDAEDDETVITKLESLAQELEIAVGGAKL